ncbi:MAG: cyclopropane-fatty-acyl-phospholipid synthase family protein [Ardenticatenaceae bacterium]|nr:cyclopropane-fatty-acyl-phospholipid synthase family protein [Ardenticatenaceae bacterium]
MPAQAVRASDQAVQATLSFLQDVLREAEPRDFAVRLWDGTVWKADPEQPARFTLVLQHPGALRTMFWPPTELTLGEAYIYNDFEIEGEIERIFPLADTLLERRWGMAERLRYGRYLFSLPSGGRPRTGRQAVQLSGSRHSAERDRQAVTYHYNVSNEFYALWLDTQMVYSCAYFATLDDSLDTAQERKLDYICHKLRLRRGERLLDIGCGWGALVIHAARHYGVEARGITLSRPQAELANERIRQAGLAGHCRVEVRDYRGINEPEGFDKLASVGMFEHVGEALLPEYFERAWHLLRPGGVFLNHGIARPATRPSRQGPSFVDRYVFPDGELVPISTTLGAAERAGFEVRDVESLREHYALTLRHWVHRLETQQAAARTITDEATYRVWRLFMAGSAYGFQTGRINVYQTLLAKPDRGASGLPLTRADWYTG